MTNESVDPAKNSKQSLASKNGIKGYFIPILVLHLAECKRIFPGASVRTNQIQYSLRVIFFLRENEGCHVAVPTHSMCHLSKARGMFDTS